MSGIIEQITWLAINMYHEARGESLEGKIAIGHVVLNRARKNGISMKEVILKPYQFSWANHEARPPIGDYQAFIECQKAAIQCLEKQLEGKTLSGADLYYNPAVASPEWAKSDKVKEICVIGNHRFMRE